VDFGFGIADLGFRRIPVPKSQIVMRAVLTTLVHAFSRTGASGIQRLAEAGK